MIEDELPDGWAATALEDLLEPGGLFDGPFGSSLKTSDYTDRGARVVRLENLANLNFIEEKRTFVSLEKYHELRKHTVVEGDILFGSFLDGSVRVASMPKLDTPTIAKADCFTVRTQRNAVDRRFLPFQLGTSATREALVEEIDGATRPRITTKQLRRLTIYVPPLAEQRRIVEKVEALLAQVNAARARLAKVPTILNRFREAVLTVACSGQLTGNTSGDDGVPSHWRWCAVGDLVVPGGLFDGARDHGSGTAVDQNLRTVDYTDHGVRVIRLENITHMAFVADKHTYISEAKYKGLRQATVLEGDVIVGSFVDGAVRVCTLPHLETPAVAKADCFCVRTNPNVVRRDYLVLQLACKRTHSALLDEVHGATRPRISTRQLREIQVPLCSLEEQAEVVRRANAMFAIVEKVQRYVAAGTARADKMPQAILAKAFRGELVPTEAELARQKRRDYESASALLARIRAARADTPAKASTGRAGQRASGRVSSKKIGARR